MLTAVDPAGRLGFAVADLTADEGWDLAVKGVDYVLHVASPLGGTASGDPDAMIAPARDGALRVLRSATAAGVKRVVMTSAANAASPSSYATEGVTDETLWTDPQDPTLSPYRRSKTLAEQAAWDFMTDYQGPTELTTVLPGAVFGPVLTTSNIGSVGIIGRMVSGSMRGVPRIGLEIVDVRDLADIHIRAMTSPDAAGQRFLATGEFTWMTQMARTLREGLGAEGLRVSTRQVPDVVVRLVARFRDPSLREITPRWAAATATAPTRPTGSWAGSPGPPGKPSWTAPAACWPTTPSDRYAPSAVGTAPGPSVSGCGGGLRRGVGRRRRHCGRKR